MGIVPTTLACVLTKNQTMTSWCMGLCSTNEQHQLGLGNYLQADVLQNSIAVEINLSE